MLKCSNVNMTKGFTLMEAIFATFLITAGIIGTYTLITHTIVSVAISTQRLTAAYLAQEGIEIVRNIRDTNWLETYVTPTPWNEGLDLGEREADYNDQDLTQCLFPCDYDNHLRFLKIDGGFYNYDSGNDTKFKRKIILQDGPIPVDTLNVKVEIFWQERGKPYSIEAQEILYNWK